jgi:hypothetical protein
MGDVQFATRHEHPNPNDKRTAFAMVMNRRRFNGHVTSAKPIVVPLKTLDLFSNLCLNRLGQRKIARDYSRWALHSSSPVSRLYADRYYSVL